MAINFLDLTTEMEIVFVPLCITAVFLYRIGQQAGAEKVKDGEFRRFQNLFFIPYFIALFTDWLQGPYVYKLYSYYGFPQDRIAILYVVGFASSVTVGTITGPLADKFGRKKMTILFCILYFLCCATKVSANFYILLTGRLFGGVSTSILMSVFESWYIHEHVARNFPVHWMSLTFSKATYFNGLLAISAGIVAHVASECLELGPLSPFVLAMPHLVLCAFLVAFNWEENYGEREMNCVGLWYAGLKEILSNRKILVLGVIQSLFESNLYIFVFLWTPVLKAGDAPVGLTFACFMVAVMIGASIYSVLLKYRVRGILRYCLLTSTVSLLVCGVSTAPEFQNELVLVSFVSFFVLEMSVGMYYPCVAQLRGEIIPDNLRASIMNWFRVPMNLMTCGALTAMYGTHLDFQRANQIVFLVCAASALLAALLSFSLSSKAVDEEAAASETNTQPSERGNATLP